jgi:magnesium-transporting ATPase (P-type)
MSSIVSQELNLSSKSALANKTKQTSTEEIYNKIYSKQLLEIFKLTISFLLTNLLIRLLDNTLLNNYLKNKLLYFILLIVLLISVTFIASNIFTYLQITNEQEKFLEKLSDN